MKTDHLPLQQAGAVQVIAIDLSVGDASTACIQLIGSDGATALVSLHGAQVLSWIPADGRERLFLSPRADIAPGAAIRGGIPVIFPQFAGHGPLPKHGFARNQAWRFDGVGEDAGVGHVAFVLEDNHATRTQWPHAFRARLLVALAGDALTVTLQIHNTGSTRFGFTTALHTYLRTNSLLACRLEGVTGQHYLDSTRGGQVGTTEDALLEFGPEIDRIFTGSSNDKILREGGQVLSLRMQGFADTVVWNPGARLAAGIADLAHGDEQHFVCIEPANIADPVTLGPDEHWQGIQQLQA